MNQNTTNPIQLVRSSTKAFLKSINSPLFSETKDKFGGIDDEKSSNEISNEIENSSSNENFKKNDFHYHIDTPKNALTKLTNHIASMVWKKLESPRFSKFEFDEIVSNDGFVESLFVEWDNVENDEDIETVLGTTANVPNSSLLQNSSISSSLFNGSTTQFHEESKTNDADLHFRDVENNPRLTAQYILVLSALNFCFWPSVKIFQGNDNDNQTEIYEQEIDYPELARGLKRIAENYPHLLSSSNLARVTEQDLVNWLGSSNIPLLSERVRLLNEVGIILDRYFDGEAAVLIESARKSATSLVSLVTSYFPGFRDHTISPVDGKQIFFYKRAQIFCSDIWGSFSGKGLGEFYDMNQVTMFADYQVPQVLRHLGVMVYDKHLSNIVDNNKVLPAGSPEELEIRACTICIVEEIRQILEKKHRIRCKSVEIDWYLWQQGERLKRHSLILPHHRTYTIYY